MVGAGRCSNDSDTRLTCYFVCRAAFACGYHDKQFHDGAVDPRAARLDNEDVFFTNTRQDPDAGLALRAVGLAKTQVQQRE